MYPLERLDCPVAEGALESVTDRRRERWRVTLRCLLV